MCGHAYPRLQETDRERTVSFTLKDKDVGDQFLVKVRPDLAFGTPHFELLAGEAYVSVYATPLPGIPCSSYGGTYVHMSSTSACSAVSHHGVPRPRLCCLLLLLLFYLGPPTPSGTQAAANVRTRLAHSSARAQLSACWADRTCRCVAVEVRGGLSCTIEASVYPTAVPALIGQCPRLLQHSYFS